MDGFGVALAAESRGCRGTFSSVAGLLSGFMKMFNGDDKAKSVIDEIMKISYPLRSDFVMSLPPSSENTVLLIRRNTENGSIFEFSNYELTTIIAYSLSSSEYDKEIRKLRQRAQLQRALKQKFEQNDSPSSSAIRNDDDEKEEEEEDEKKEKVNVIRMRRDSKGRIGIKFDMEMNVCGVSSWAKQSGIRVGHKIVACEGIQIESHAELVSAIPSRGDNRAFSLHVKYIGVPQSLSSSSSEFFFTSEQTESKDASQLISGVQDKISHVFRDEETGTKFECHSYFPLQFEALRRIYLRGGNRQYLESLARCAQWKAKGGKSGALFLRTLDNRFVIKDVKDTELRTW